MSNTPEGMRRPNQWKNGIFSNSQAGTVDPPESIKRRLQIDNKCVKAGAHHEFTLVTYNCLVDWHAYDDYAFRVDPQYLSSDFRHARILEELEYLNGDIVCLQEITPDFYNNTLTEWFTSREFCCKYVQRICGRTDEGCAVFYRRDKFICKRIQLVQFKEDLEELLKITSLPAERYSTEQNALIVELQLTGTPHIVVVATTHLLFGDFLKPDVQVLQIAHLKQLLKQRYSGSSAILCGDFNSYPDTPQYNFATSGTLSAEQWNTMAEQSSLKENASLFKDIRGVIEQFDASSHFSSAYKDVMGSEPEVTCVDHVYRCCLDYVLYRDSIGADPVKSKTEATENSPSYTLVPISVLNTMPLKEIQKAVPPSHIYPSDHFPLFVKFAFIDSSAPVKKE